MFGSRPDGDRIRDLPRMRAFMPFISPRRNDSLVYYSTTIAVDPALELLEELNADRPERRRITLFHLYLHCLARGFHARPGVNRFVAGGRLWQRNHVALTYSAKQEIVDGAPVLTIKRVFPEHEGLVEMVDSMLDRLEARRGGEKTQSDAEVNLALRTPVLFLRGLMWLLHRLNMTGLMPGPMIDDDPLFTSAFVANLGSVGLEAGYHHLWEWGTCSAFAVMGAIHEDPEGKRSVEIRYSYDERVEDGLYAALTMERIKQELEAPRNLLQEQDKKAI